MNEAEDQRPSDEEVAALAREIEERILQTADGGPYKRIDLSDYGPEDVEALEKKYGVAVECDYDSFPKSIRVPEEVNDSSKGWTTYYVAVHELTRHYGGHEEGGWWYDCGHLVDHDCVRVHFDLKREPWLGEGEKKFLNQLAYYLLFTYEEFGTSYRSSMRQRKDDYQWGIYEEPPADWNGYQPYC